MKLRLFTIVVFTTAAISATRAAPQIELEVATQRGVQITAPHEWLQLLTSVGIENVRIRGMTPGDEAKVTNHGTADHPNYLVLGILTAGNQLRLPGETFTPADRTRLKDYFDRLTADGADSLTSPRGPFGLTEKELAAVLADLSQPIDFETRGQSPPAVLERMQSKLVHKLVVDAAAQRKSRETKPLADEFRGITAGAGLAMMLRGRNCVLLPEKVRGEAVTFRIAAADFDSFPPTLPGDMDDAELKSWPVGWKPQQTPGRTAPSLFEPRNAEIDGYTLDETLAAIGARIKVPMYLDHAALAAHRIEPGKIQVQLARTRSVYKRIIDRVLAPARLHSDLRVDEAGKPFLWVTR